MHCGHMIVIPKDGDAAGTVVETEAGSEGVSRAACDTRTRCTVRETEKNTLTQCYK